MLNIWEAETETGHWITLQSELILHWITLQSELILHWITLETEQLIRNRDKLEIGHTEKILNWTKLNALIWHWIKLLKGIYHLNWAGNETAGSPMNTEICSQYKRLQKVNSTWNSIEFSQQRVKNFRKHFFSDTTEIVFYLRLNSIWKKHGQFQHYGCDIWTQNNKQNSSEKSHFLHNKNVKAYYHGTHLAEGKGQTNN